MELWWERWERENAVKVPEILKTHTWVIKKGFVPRRFRRNARRLFLKGEPK